MARVRPRQLVALGLGVLVVGLLLASVGPRSVADALANARGEFLFFGFAAYALFFLVRGVRWQRLLAPRSPDLTVATAANLTAMGWVVSSFVPMKAGDVTRSAVVARRHQRPFADVIGTVAVERALDVVGLALVASAGMFGLAFVADQHLPPTVARAVALAWILPLAGLALLIAFARALARRPSRNIVVRYALLFLAAADELRERPREIPALLGLTVLSTLLQMTIFTALFLAFQPAASPFVVAATVPLFLLSFVLSVTPGNVGTYEAAFVAVFALAGFPTSALIPMAVAVHLLTISIVTILGGSAFVFDRFTLSARAARTNARPEAEPDA